MAQHTTITGSAGAWVQLTNANATDVTFQNLSDSPVLISGTTGAVAPTTTAGAFSYPPQSGEMKKALTDMFPGVVAVRLWAYSVNGKVQVSVSHA